MPAFSAIYTIRDAKGETSVMEVKVPDNLTVVNLGIFAQQMANLVDNVITGAITRIGVALSFPLPGTLKAAPLANSDVEEGARFGFRTTNGYPTGFRVPTFDEALIASGSKEVNTVDADVAALITAVVAGINLVPVGGTGTVGATDDRGEDIIALNFAKEQFLSSR